MLPIFRLGLQKCISGFHNLSYWIPILKWDTSMGWWLSSLTIYININIYMRGSKFYPVFMSLFPCFQWDSVWVPKTALPDSITSVIGYRFWSGIPLCVGGWIL